MASPLFRRLILLCALLAVMGAGWAAATASFPSADPTIPNFSNNFYLYTFSHFEPFSLYATAVFFLGVYFFTEFSEKWLKGVCQRLLSPRLPLFIAFGFLILACLGRIFVHQNFDLCIDEYLNEFEVRILQHHQLVAEVPQAWLGDENAMKVGYQNFHGNAEKGYWASGFLPGFAFLDYLFESIDLGWALSPLLGTISLLVLAKLIARAFPTEGTWVVNGAVLLLALSPQFLVMAFTKFAWPAHLCGTLVWIWLFTHPRKKLFGLTPILGAFLIGLHQPQVHFLAVAPFLLRLVYTWKWRAVLWFIPWYLAGMVGWYNVMVLLRPTPTGQVGPISEMANMGFPVLFSFFVTICHAITLYAWMTPLLLPLVLIAALNWRSQPALIQDSFFALLITFLFYISFPHLQGHGWGYRYVHSVYGLFALVAAGGMVSLRKNVQRHAVLHLVMLSLLFSFAVQIPYRIYEVRAMVKPLASAWAYIANRPADFVIIETSQFWYACDLIRNDPWLVKKPLVFDAKRLSPRQKSELSQRGTVTMIGANEVHRFGVILSNPAKK